MPILTHEQLEDFNIPAKDPARMRVAISHEFVEMYRGDKDIRVGEILARDYGCEIVHLGTDIASPGDSVLFGSNRYPVDKLPPLPENYYLLLQKSRLVWHRKGNMGMGGFFRLTPSIIPQLLRWKPDIIFENPYLTLSPRSYMTYIAARKLRIPIVYLDCGDILTELKLKNRIVLPLEKRVVRRAAMVLTFNRSGERRFIDKYQYPAERIRVIPKPVDTARFSPDIPSDAFKSEFGLFGKFVVAYFGRLCTNKGAGYLLEAAEILKRRNEDRDMIFLFVGGNLEAGHSAEFKRRFDRLSLDNVRMTGMISNSRMPEAYASADIAVFPDVTNPPGFSTVLAEAMASGLPIIIGNKGAETATPLVDGENGLIVAAGNPDELADRIIRLRNDSELLHRLASNVLKYTRREMDYKELVKRYYEVLAEAFGAVIFGSGAIVSETKKLYSNSA